MVKFADYINKQNTDCNSYIDYIIACKKLNIALTVNQNKYPNNFDKWHDKRIDEYHEVKTSTHNHHPRQQKDNHSCQQNICDCLKKHKPRVKPLGFFYADFNLLKNF